VPADERPPANLSVRFVTRDECELSPLAGHLIQVSTLRLRTRSRVANGPRSARAANPRSPSWRTDARVPLVPQTSAPVRREFPLARIATAPGFVRERYSCGSLLAIAHGGTLKSDADETLHRTGDPESQIVSRLVADGGARATPAHDRRPGHTRLDDLRHQGSTGRRDSRIPTRGRRRGPVLTRFRLARHSALDDEGQRRPGLSDRRTAEVRQLAGPVDPP
jgi:hypothetical protein